MIFVSYIKYELWKLLEVICSKWHIYAFVKTNAGLKNLNMSCLYGDRVYEDSEKIITVNPQELYLSIDYLKDQFTLLDCCILDSPHYAFIEAINRGENFKKTDYYRRFIRGELDGRYCQKERKELYFLEKNKRAKSNIESGDYKPVSIFTWKGRLYISDGKHRAALCAYLKKDVRCVIVPSIPNFRNMSINKEIYKIIDGDKCFSKHIKFLNDGQE